MNLDRTRIGIALTLALWAGAAPAQEPAAIEKRGALRVGLWDQVMGEFFQPSGKPNPGFEHELLLGYAELHRVKLEVMLKPSMDELLDALASGEVDVLSGGLVATAARRARADFTLEVFPTRHVIVTRRPRSAIHDAQQLRTLRVGTLPQTSWAEAIAAAGIPPQQVHNYADLTSLRKGFSSGQVDALVMTVGTAMLDARDDDAIELGGFIGARGAVAWGVKKGQRDLLTSLNAYITNVRRTATWSRLVAKYWGAEAMEILKRAQKP